MSGAASIYVFLWRPVLDRNGIKIGIQSIAISISEKFTDSLWLLLTLLNRVELVCDELSCREPTVSQHCTPSRMIVQRILCCNILANYKTLRNGEFRLAILKSAALLCLSFHLVVVVNKKFPNFFHFSSKSFMQSLE